jgi:hypothetical protein
MDVAQEMHDGRYEIRTVEARGPSHRGAALGQPAGRTRPTRQPM